LSKIKRPFSFLLLFLCFVSLFVFSVNASEPVNLIKNGKPITSTADWIPLSTNNLMFGYSGTNSIYMTCNKASSLYGMSIKSPTFQTKADTDYVFHADLVFSNWSGASLTIEVVNGDRSKISYVRTENIVNGTYEVVGEFVGSSDTFVINMSASQYSALPSGASFQIHSAEVYERNAVVDAIDKQTEEQKGMFAKLFENISNFFLGLFIPENGFFDNFFQELNTWFGDRFGFLYYPFEVIIEILGRFTNFTPPSVPQITIPQIELDGQEYIPTQTYAFDFLATGIWHTIHQFYLAFMDCLIAFGLLNLASKKLNEVMTQ